MEVENREGKKLGDLGQGVNIRVNSLIVPIICLNTSLELVDKPLRGSPMPHPVPDT